MRKGVVALLLCAVVALAIPATAAAKRVKLEGPVELAPIEPGVIAPASIELAVRYKKDGGKLKPSSVFPLKEHDIYETCPDGSHVYLSEGNSETSFVSTFGYEMFVKRRKFSGADPGSEIDVSGKIARDGTASGTIRMTGPGPPPSYPPCDSGLLSWTAAPTG